MANLILPSGTALPLCASDAGSTLSELLLRFGFGVNAPCGGTGKCGKCSVRVSGKGLSFGAPVQNGYTLACRCTVTDPSEDIVLTDAPFIGFPTNPAVETTLVPDPSLGLAVDLGTTTVAVSLWSLGSSPERLGETHFFNPQAAYGADVISRVAAARRGKAGELRRVLSETLLKETEKLCIEAHAKGFPATVALAANTAMLCLALGFDVNGLARAPFTMPERFGKSFPLGLLFPGCSGTLLVPPAVGPFIGADTTAALYAVRFTDCLPPALFLDLGTNGEMALWDGKRLLCCSAAAGPALEGAGISCGGLYGPGAVADAFVHDGRLTLSTCGNAPADRVCASGLIACAAALLELGKILPNGTVADEAERKNGIPLGESGLKLTKEDIRALQLAKAAVRAGLAALMRRLPEGSNPCLYLTGGIPAGKAAVRTGLLPAGLPMIAAPGALEGAELLLTQPVSMDEMRALSEKAELLSLSEEPLFEEDLLRYMKF